MKFRNIVLPLACCVMMVACGSKNKQAEVQVPAADSIPQVMKLQPFETAEDITVKGVAYSYRIQRSASDSIPQVKSQQGTDYADNIITLTIKRKDGAVVLNRTFTKNSFASIIADADFLKTTLLLGIAYDGVGDDGNMHFVASVGDPDLDDLYFPLELIVSTGGVVKIQKSVEMDGNVPNDSLSVSQE